MEEGGALGWRDWRTLVATYVLPHRRRVALLGGLLAVSIGLQVGAPLLVKTFLDRATSADHRPLGLLAYAYVAAALLQQAARIGVAWLGEIVGWVTTNRLRTDLVEHCLDLDPSFHVTHTPGELIERVDGDVSGLSVFFAHFLLEVVGNLLLLVGILGVVWWQDLVGGLVLTLLAAFAIATLLGVRRVGARHWVVAREASARLFGFLEERLAGTEDIRSCGAEDHTLAGLYDVARERTWTNRSARVRTAVHWMASSTVTVVATAVSFVVPAWLVRSGSVTIGGAFAIYFYTQLLLQPLHSVSDQVEQLQQAAAGGRRVLELLRRVPLVTDGPGVEVPAGALSVSFTDVRFGYGADPSVLHGVTLHVPAGGVLGVVGRTGSGKSTLARLLVRLHDPDAGSVSIGGVDLRTLRRHDVRHRVALVSQEVHLLRATVRDNLTLFDPSVDDGRIREAVTRLGLGAWLEALPDGLETLLSEGGRGISAGQAQLLAFGRAFLADPSVVVLDEASSRLDPATERLLESAVDALLEGRTGIVIAHRLATLERCDAICVLERGRIAELGSRTVLAADPGSHFARLLRAGHDAAVA